MLQHLLHGVHEAPKAAQALRSAANMAATTCSRGNDRGLTDPAMRRFVSHLQTPSTPSSAGPRPSAAGRGSGTR